jgi:hypothetical protein
MPAVCPLFPTAGLHAQAKPELTGRRRRNCTSKFLGLQGPTRGRFPPNKPDRPTLVETTRTISPTCTNEAKAPHRSRRTNPTTGDASRIHTSEFASTGTGEPEPFECHHGTGPTRRTRAHATGCETNPTTPRRGLRHAAAFRTSDSTAGTNEPGSARRRRNEPGPRRACAKPGLTHRPRPAMQGRTRGRRRTDELA